MSVLCDLPEGTSTIDGTSMNCPAWSITSGYVDLWLPGDVRGSDVIMPGSPGVRAKRRRETATRFSLPMSVCGEVDNVGIPYADPWVGLEENINDLRSLVLNQPGSGDGTRNMVLTMPSGSQRSRRIHVLGFDRGATGEGTNNITGGWGVIMLGTLEISVPRGSFVAGGS